MEVVFSSADEQARRRILEHCLALADPEPRPSARERLEKKVGRDLARLLVFALSGRHSRPRTRLPGREMPKRRM